MKQGSLYPRGTVNLQSQTTLAGTTALYGTQYQRDKLGRITRKIESVEGITTVYDYRYDSAGRLVTTSSVLLPYALLNNDSFLTAYRPRSKIYSDQATRQLS